MSIYFMTFVNVLIEMLFLEMMAGTFFFEKERGGRWQKAFGFTGAAIVLMANTILLQGAFWPKIILVFFIGYLYIAAFYQAKTADILGSITFYYSIMAGIDFIIILIFLCSRTLSKNSWLFYGLAFLAKCMELGIGVLIRRVWSRGNHDRTISKEIRRLMFFSGILIWIGAFITEFLTQNDVVPEDILFLMIGIICLSDFSLLYLLLAARAEMERDSLRDIAAQTRMQLELYKNKQDLYTRQGKRSHEHKNQLLTIGHMLEQGQSAQALEYTRSLTGSMAKELDHIYTNHPIADAILNLKKQEAADKGIRINFLCSDLKSICLKEEEIIILLGNLLDNAIEASLKCKADKHIQARMTQEEKQLIIVVKNTCEQPLVVEDDRIVSTKEKDGTHGYGLAAVRDIAERYDGSFIVRQKDGYVKAAVVIPNP